MSGNIINKNNDTILFISDSGEPTLIKELEKQGLIILQSSPDKNFTKIISDSRPAIVIIDVVAGSEKNFHIVTKIREDADDFVVSVAILDLSMNLKKDPSSVSGYKFKADAFLTKPVEPTELYATIGALLRMKKAETDLRNQNNRLKILSEAAFSILSNNQSDHMVSKIFKLISSNINIDTYFNYLVDEQENILVLDSFAGLSDDQVAAAQTLQFGQALCGTVAQECIPITIANVQQYQNPKAEFIKNLGIRAYACNPLISDEKIFGTLSFATKERDFFTEDELAFFRVITHYVSLAKQKEMLVKTANERAAELKKVNERKDEFLANMSHEIRTPMNAVIGLANILAMSSPLTDKQQEFISTLQLSAKSLLSLINDLLDISKIESGNVQLENTQFNLKTLLEESIDIMGIKAHEKNIALKLLYDKKLGGEFSGDPLRLRQVIMNLISNAVKFTDKGYVSVQVKPYKKSFRNKLSENEVHISITIKDSGIGIPEDKTTSIFNKFSQADTSITRKFGGSGLGLAITKGLVEIMRGEIKLETKLGSGSKFTVIIPLLQESKQDEPISNVDDNSAKAMIKPRILLVEDYKPNIIVATHLLDFLGYEYEIAQNGKEAVDKVSNQNFNVILMDIQMPIMDGYTATKNIRKYELDRGAERTPIIGITAFALNGDKEKCLAVGMDDYISKPFNPDELKEKLKLYSAA